MKKTAVLFGIVAIIACGNTDRYVDGNAEPGLHNDENHETITFTDPRDGHTYKTVKVGEQWVMAENLAYKPEEGNYWAYDNDENNIALYGYLYDFETAMNITPDGWHLPSREEWFALLKTLGAKRTTFKFLEQVYPKMVAGGSSGLEMLFGGMRTCDGRFIAEGDKARFWNSDDTGSENATFGLNKNTAGEPHGLNGSTAPYVFNNGYQKACPGYNIRLFKD